MYLNAKEVGLRVRKLREAKDMTIGMLADEMNCSRGHLSKAERGVRSYSIDLLIDLSQYFEVSLDYLVFGKNANNTETMNEILDVISNLSEIARKL